MRGYIVHLKFFLPLFVGMGKKHVRIEWNCDNMGAHVHMIM
jgi:hypothetical protein